MRDVCSKKKGNAARHPAIWHHAFPPTPVFRTFCFESRSQLTPFANCPIPIHLDEKLRPCATLARGICPHRVLVCSLPKAGTYFIAELLRQIGCESIGMHIDHAVVWDYRQRTIEEIRTDSFRYIVEMPLELSLRLIRKGQFAVGHIEHNNETRGLLRGLKKVFVCRDLRDALISQMRFLKDTNCRESDAERWRTLPDGPQQMAIFFQSESNVNYMFSKYRNMAGWTNPMPLPSPSNRSTATSAGIAKR